MERSLAPFLLASFGAATAPTTTGIDVVVPYAGKSSRHVSRSKTQNPPRRRTSSDARSTWPADGARRTTKRVMNGAWDGLTIISGPETMAVHHHATKVPPKATRCTTDDEIQTMGGATVRMGSFNGDTSGMTVHLSAAAGLEKLAEQATGAVETGFSAAGSATSSGSGSAGSTSMPSAGAVWGLRPESGETLARVLML